MLLSMYSYEEKKTTTNETDTERQRKLEGKKTNDKYPKRKNMMGFGVIFFFFS